MNYLLPNLLGVIALAVTANVGFAQRDVAAAPGSRHWVASWASSQVGPEPSQPQLPAGQLTDATLRQIVHLSIGGTTLRVQLSNAFGTEPLTVDTVHVARAVLPASSAIDPATDRAVSFDGSSSVVIPVGASYLSDPVMLPMAPLSNLAVSFHYAQPPSVQTSHPGSRATSYLVHGVHSGETELAGAVRTVRWLGLAEVDVVAAPEAGTVVAFGDSITDGHASTTDGNDRWPDDLARRLQASSVAGERELAVVNEGIGGNHLLTNGLGENSLERFDRDVLAVSGVRCVLLLEGINDLGGLGRTPNATAAQHTELVAAMEGALRQIVERAHAHGIRVIGATIMADGGSTYYHPDAADDAARRAVNAWILAPGNFDGVVDFDKATRDAAIPLRLNPAFDSGDHLHPGPVGYKAMGDAVPLGLF
jgi:lysophospholipase L1-like esterase